MTQVAKDVGKATTERSEAQMKKQNSDMQTLQEYPELHPQSQNHNKRFHNEAQKQLATIIKEEGEDSILS